MIVQDYSPGKNYNSGKRQEKEADYYLQSKGYLRPTGIQKNNIVKAFDHMGIILKPRAFDLVEDWIIKYTHDVQKLTGLVKLGLITLYELKSASATRKTPITESWEGLGFTYSSNEDHNWKVLGDDHYKFIFVDCLRQRHIVLEKDDWLKNARTTDTMSVWITNPLEGRAEYNE
tara:strand:+ start:841 stop:1362 length:522 start_codon:yes stop_codon:yes gene_type:complete